MNWTLYNLRGARDQVKATIAASDKLPAPDKAYLQALIDAQPAECFGISVNAYVQTNTVGNDLVTNVNFTISCLK